MNKQKILIVLISLFITAEAIENICIDKEDARYSREELQAYYIREKKIILLEKKCKQNDTNSCLLLSIEYIYNFHPCYTENEKLKEKGLEKFKFFCKKNSAEACFILGYLEIEDEEVNQDKYLSMACQLDNKYCSQLNQEIDKIKFLDEMFDYHKDKLIRYKKVKKRVNFFNQSCVRDKNDMACYQLYLLYSHYTQLIGLINSWIDEVDFSKVDEYRYKSCIYSYTKIGCSAEYETDDEPPKKWLIDRAKKLKFVIPNPKFVPIQTRTKTIKKIAKKRTCERSRVITFRDDYFKKEWQINENSKLGIIDNVCNEEMGYVEGTTLDICKRLIPKNYSNWRLPLKKELLDIINLFDESIDFKYYWTSEQSKEDLMDYWVVNVKNGTTHEVYKNNHYDKGCVYIRDFQ